MIEQTPYQATGVFKKTDLCRRRGTDRIHLPLPWSLVHFPLYKGNEAQSHVPDQGIPIRKVDVISARCQAGFVTDFSTVSLTGYDLIRALEKRALDRGPGSKAAAARTTAAYRPGTAAPIASVRAVAHFEAVP